MFISFSISMRNQSDFSHSRWSQPFSLVSAMPVTKSVYIGEIQFSRKKLLI